MNIMVLLFGISGGEILVILLLVLILFGPKKIPEIARTVGKAINEVKKVQRDINVEINRYSEEIEKPTKQITGEIDKYSKAVNDPYGYDYYPSTPPDTVEKNENNKNSAPDTLPNPLGEEESLAKNAQAESLNSGGPEVKS